MRFPVSATAVVANKIKKALLGMTAKYVIIRAESK
jgi:hypothetical protein